jgi:predicted nuclease of predicted toxin-antitoxin system
MHFLLDENVPASVLDVLRNNEHTVQFIRDFVPPGSQDQVVATVAEQLEAVLVSFDGDFEKIAPRIPDGARRRFRSLSRIWMQCNEIQAAQRLSIALELIETEYLLATNGQDGRMHIWLSNGYIKTYR